MFEKKPLYEIKKKTLRLGVDLLNAQSKALHEALELNKSSLIKVKNRMDVNIKNREDWSTDLDLEFILKDQEVLLNASVKRLVEQKERILSMNNGTVTMFNSDPFDYLNIFKKRRTSPCMQLSFANNAHYKKTQSVEKTFEAARKNELKMISLRVNTACALIGISYLTIFWGLLATSIALVACVNPIAGFVLLGLSIAASVYYMTRMRRDMTALSNHFTDVGKKIELGQSDQALFPELDALVARTATPSDDQKPAARLSASC
jgi:hypothetical protein